MIYLLLFVLGLCVGSFLNVLIYREAKDEGLRILKPALPAGRLKSFKKWLPSWVRGRSYCDYCKKKLSWFDNIPLLSFILLRGRCRFCQKNIPLQYPLVEFLTGVEFVWVYFLIQSQVNFFSRFEGFFSFLSLLIWLGLGACFLAIFIADLRYQIIPDTAVLGAVFLSFLRILANYRYTAMLNWSWFTAAVLAALFFLGLVLITKGKGMGIGDVKLAFLMGLILGFPQILYALSFAFLTGALFGGILIIFGKKKLKSQIPFGPFLVLGTIFGLLFEII